MSLVILIKSSEYFIKAAKKIGHAIGMPAFIIGLTILAIGTSLPELIASILSVLSNSSEIVVGNVIGSNIANIFLVIGITAIAYKKIKIKRKIANIDIIFFIGSALLFTATILDGVFAFHESILFIAFIIVYFFCISRNKNNKRKDDKYKEIKNLARDTDKHDNWETFAILIINAILIYISAKYTVESIIQISDFLVIGKEVIAASVIAIGTSLPELTVSLQAAKRKHFDMMAGNIIGSNIFNILAVMGIPALFGTLIIPQGLILFALPMMLIATVLYLVMIKDRKITNWEGMVFILFYLLFMLRLFGLI